MARIASLAVLKSGGGNDYLAELYGGVIENIEKQGIAAQIKNRSLSGTPTSGTVEAKRFANRSSNAYGTARSGHAGQKVTAEPVTIAINQDKELVTEIEEKDVSLYGVDNFLQRQVAMDQKSMNRELEKAFWTEAKTAGTQLTLNGQTIEEKIEEMIQAVETVSNQYVDGVDRDMIILALVPSVFAQIRTYLDSITHEAGGAEVGTYHGVKIFSSTYLPSGVTTGVVMANESIAQPVLPTLVAPQQIPLSNAVATGLFYSYGTKAVTPDLIFWA